MFEHASLAFRRTGMIAAVGWLLFHSAMADAKPSESPAGSSAGQIDFAAVNLPPANVEFNLSQAMIENLVGISDAAVSGATETLAKSAQGEQADALHLAAEQLTALREIIGLTGKVVREVRIRVYESLPEDLSTRFDGQLREGNWENIVVVRQEGNSARAYVIQQDDAIRGVFVVAHSEEGQVLVNVVCDISPDKVKNLTLAATKIGLDNNLQQLLEKNFRQKRGPSAASLAEPPKPPKAPAAVENGEK